MMMEILPPATLLLQLNLRSLFSQEYHAGSIGDKLVRLLAWIMASAMVWCPGSGYCIQLWFVFQGGLDLVFKFCISLLFDPHLLIESLSKTELWSSHVRWLLIISMFLALLLFSSLFPYASFIQNILQSKWTCFSHVPVASPCHAMLTLSPFLGMPLSISVSADSINLLRLRLGSTFFMKCSLISF